MSKFSLKRSLRRLRIRLGSSGAEILRLYDDLDGLLSVEESAWLYRNAAGMKRIVEIGSYRGKSCVLLACGEPSARVTAIDPHYGQGDRGEVVYDPEDTRRMNEALTRHGVADRVTHIVKESHAARGDWDEDADGPTGGAIDLLWIDGDHSYEGVATDLDDWAGLVRKGGLIAGHDYGHLESVRRAWDERIGESADWGETGRVRSIAWARRVGQ
jgi:MMP 1-O-methyltransferase